jgi:hypothetical protein
MRHALLRLVLTAAAAASAFPQQVGEILFLDGEVEVLRDEQTLSDLGIGDAIENLDRIRTGRNGQVTMAITAGYGAPCEIRVAPATAFYVEIDRLERRSTTTVGLLTGSVGLKVQRLSGNRDLSVRTETTALGVRGTTFEVATSPAGDVLVTTSEGSVACTEEEKGVELLAEPGQAVELRGEAFRTVPVAVSSVEQFQREWVADRVEAFRANALRVTRAYAQRYDRLVGEFNDAYADLMRNAAVLAKWAREERDGAAGSPMEAMREKRALVGALLRLRKTLFVFERVYYRLNELEGYYTQGIGRGDLRPGLPAAQFWRRFAEESRDLAAKMARVRAVVRMYARRNDGQFPVEF